MVIKGDYPPHEGNVLANRASIVLGSSGFERLSYYTMTGSLTVFFSRELNMDSVFAQQMQAVFQSIVYLMPILGAFIADTWTGRYLISIASLGFAAIGAAGLLTGTATDTNWLCLLSLFLLLAAPIAMVKPNLIVLGADQFHEKKPDQMKQRDTFFGAYYWITNIAAAIAFLVFSQIAVEGMGAVKQEWSFSFVFACGTVFVVISFCILALGSKYLFAPKPTGSPLVDFFKVTGKALKGAPSKQGIWVLCGIFGLFAAVIASIPSFFFDAPALDYVLAAIILVSCLLLIVFGRTSGWVEHVNDSAPGVFSETVVAGAKDVYRLAPYIAFAIPFWSVYNQMNTSFISQGCQCNNNIGSVSLAPSIMPTFNSIVIVIIIPIFNYGIYPCMAKIGGGKFTLSPLRRIGLGFIASALAMLNGALTEYARKAAPILYTECDQEAVDLGWCTISQIGTQIPELSSCYEYVGDNASEPVPKRDYQLMIQIIQYGLIGLAEILVAITYYDFFYSQVPPFMRSVCQAIQMMTTSLGTMVGAVINNLCKAWLPNNLDNGNQEYMYFINMGFCLVMCAIFAFVSRGFEYKPGTSLMPGDERVEETKSSSSLEAGSEGPKAMPEKKLSKSESVSYYSDDE